MRRYISLGAVVIGLMVSGCGGDDDETATSPAPSGGLPPPSDGAPAPGSPGGFTFPPEFLECMAAQGFDIPPTGGPPPELLADPNAQRAFQECVEFLPPGAGNH